MNSDGHSLLDVRTLSKDEGPMKKRTKRGRKKKRGGDKEYAHLEEMMYLATHVGRKRDARKQKTGI